MVNILSIFYVLLRLIMQAINYSMHLFINYSMHDINVHKTLWHKCIHHSLITVLSRMHETYTQGQLYVMDIGCYICNGGREQDNKHHLHFMTLTLYSDFHPTCGLLPYGFAYINWLIWWWWDFPHSPDTARPFYESKTYTIKTSKYIFNSWLLIKQDSRCVILVPGHVPLCPDYPANNDFPAYPKSSISRTIRLNNLPGLSGY